MTQVPISTEDLPPVNYEVEEELREFAPRAVPDALRANSDLRRLDRRSHIGMFAMAGALLLCSVAPGLRDLGPAWLPLNLLQLAAIAVAIVNFARIYFGEGQWGKVAPWLTQGEVLVGNVVALDMVPVQAVPGLITGFQIHATVNFLHPDNALPIRSILVSRTFSPLRRKQMTTSFKVGDAVTLLWRWDRVEDSLRLYDFLGVRPGVGVVPRHDGGGRAWTALVAWGLLPMLILGAILSARYANFRYPTLVAPLEHVSHIVTAVGLLTLVVATVVAYFFDRRQRRLQTLTNELADANGEPVDRGPATFWSASGPVMLVVKGLVLFVIGLIGATFFMAGAITMNARLDTSTGSEWRVNIQRRFVRTHTGVLHEYGVEYRLAGEREVHQFFASAERIRDMPMGPGYVVVSRGFFSWPWVRDLRPTAYDRAGGRGIPPPPAAQRQAPKPAPPPAPDAPPAESLSDAAPETPSETAPDPPADGETEPLP